MRDGRFEMIYPPIDEMLKQVPSKYALVIIASKRARELTSYRLQLTDGELFSSLAAPRVDSTSRNPLTVAFEELAAGKLEWVDPSAA